MGSRRPLSRREGRRGQGGNPRRSAGLAVLAAGLRPASASGGSGPFKYLAGVLVALVAGQEELRRAVRGLHDVVVLLARPHVDPRMGRLNADVVVDHAPGRLQAPGIPDGDLVVDGVGVDLADALDGRGLVAVVGLAALVLTGLHADRVDNQDVTVL